MTAPLIFQESYDSTRVTGKDPAGHVNLAQAQAETLISLLLGRTIVVNNVYSLDSRSVLEIMDVALSTRASVRDAAANRADTGALARIDATGPFQLRYFNAPDLLESWATQLERTTPLRERFVLSAWPRIDQEPWARRELASALRSGREPRWLAEFEIERQFQSLSRLASYVKAAPGRSRPTVPANNTLSGYLQYFEGLSEEDLARIAAASGCSYGVAQGLRARLKGVQANKGNRGWIHVTVAESEEEDRFELEQLQELVDTFYNAILAETAGAQFEFFSSVPRTDGRDELKQVNDLAVKLIGERRGRVPAVHRQEAHKATADAISGLFTASTMPDLPSAPLKSLFTTYWELIADSALHRSWQQSSVLLNAELLRIARARRRGDTRDAGPFRQLWFDHVSLLRAELPGIGGDDDQFVLDLAHEGTPYRATHQATEPDPELADESYATGRYLDDLAGAVA